MTNRQWRLLGALAAAMLAAAPLSAAEIDTIQLRDGKSVAGEITATSKTEITIQALVGAKREEQKIPANEVISVEWKDEPIALRVSRGAEKNGQLQAALDGYRKNLDEATGNVKTDVQFLIARTLAKFALADPQRQAEAVTALEEFLAQNGNNFRAFEALGYLADVYLAQGNFEQAAATYEKLGQAPWNEMKMAARIGAGRVAMAQDQLDQALQEFQAVAQLPSETPADKARQHEALLGQAEVLRKQNRPAEATQLLDQVIQETAADNVETLATAYNLKGDSLQAEGKTKDALLAYLHVDVLFFSVPDQHAKALQNMATLWEKEGRPDRAGEARARLQSLYQKDVAVQ